MTMFPLLFFLFHLIFASDLCSLINSDNLMIEGMIGKGALKSVYAGRVKLLSDADFIDVAIARPNIEGMAGTMYRKKHYNYSSSTTSPAEENYHHHYYKSMSNAERRRERRGPRLSSMDERERQRVEQRVLKKWQKQLDFYTQLNDWEGSAHYYGGCAATLNTSFALFEPLLSLPTLLVKLRQRRDKITLSLSFLSLISSLLHTPLPESSSNNQCIYGDFVAQNFGVSSSSRVKIIDLESKDFHCLSSPPSSPSPTSRLFPWVTCHSDFDCYSFISHDRLMFGHLWSLLGEESRKPLDFACRDKEKHCAGLVIEKTNVYLSCALILRPLWSHELNEEKEGRGALSGVFSRCLSLDPFQRISLNELIDFFHSLREEIDNGEGPLIDNDLLSFNIHQVDLLEDARRVKQIWSERVTANEL